MAPRGSTCNFLVTWLHVEVRFVFLVTIMLENMMTVVARRGWVAIFLVIVYSDGYQKKLAIEKIVPVAAISLILYSI